MAIGRCKGCGAVVRVGDPHACTNVGDVLGTNVPGYEYGQPVSADIYGRRPQDRSPGGTWPEAAQALRAAVACGRENLPTVPSAIGAYPNGAGVSVFQHRWDKSEPRVLTLGAPPDNPSGTNTFPVASTQNVGAGVQPIASSLCAGIVAQGGVVIKPLALNALYLACVIEYGAGAASQKAWFDWFQGSYNVPSCEWLRVSALPWGLGWNSIPASGFTAIAAASEGQMQGAHVPTVTAVGDITAASPWTLDVPSNARAIEVTPTDPTVNSTITIGGAAAGVRNEAAGTMIPGYTPLELSLGARGGDAISISVSADLRVCVRFFLQL